MLPLTLFTPVLQQLLAFITRAARKLADSQLCAFCSVLMLRGVVSNQSGRLTQQLHGVWCLAGEGICLHLQMSQKLSLHELNIVPSPRQALF